MKDFFDLKEISEPINKVNPRKRKLCQLLIDKIFYDVYEYDMGDWLFIESLAKSEGDKSSIATIEMLKLAMPYCPVESILSLTHAESNEILTMVMKTNQAIGLSGQPFLKH